MGPPSRSSAAAVTATRAVCVPIGRSWMRTRSRSAAMEAASTEFADPAVRQDLHLEIGHQHLGRHDAAGGGRDRQDVVARNVGVQGVEQIGQQVLRAGDVRAAGHLDVEVDGRCARESGAVRRGQLWSARVRPTSASPPVPAVHRGWPRRPGPPPSRRADPVARTRSCRPKKKALRARELANSRRAFVRLTSADGMGRLAAGGETNRVGEVVVKAHHVRRADAELGGGVFEHRVDADAAHPDRQLAYGLRQPGLVDHRRQAVERAEAQPVGVALQDLEDAVADCPGFVEAGAEAVGHGRDQRLRRVQLAWLADHEVGRDVTVSPVRTRVVGTQSNGRSSE